MSLRALIPLLVLLLAGCVSLVEIPPLSAEQRAFYHDAIVTEAWFIVTDHPEEQPTLAAYADRRALRFDGAWQSINELLIELKLPARERDTMLREALRDTYDRLHHAPPPVTNPQVGP